MPVEVEILHLLAHILLLKLLAVVPKSSWPGLLVAEVRQFNVPLKMQRNAAV